MTGGLVGVEFGAPKAGAPLSRSTRFGCAIRVPKEIVCYIVPKSTDLFCGLPGLLRETFDRSTGTRRCGQIFSLALISCILSFFENASIVRVCIF